MTLVKDVITTMTFDEAFDILESAGNDSQLVIEKACIFIEACKRDLQTNYKEAELKVIKESGTEDDLTYLYGEANNYYTEKVTDALAKAANAVVEFAKKLLEMIKNVFQSKKAKDTLDAAEKAVATDPNLKNEKVKIHPFDKLIKKIDEGLAKLKTLKAKRKAGSSADGKDIDEIVEGCSKTKTAIVAVGIPVALVTVFGTLKHFGVIGKKTGEKLSRKSARSEPNTDLSHKTKDGKDKTMEAVKNAVNAAKAEQARDEKLEAAECTLNRMKLSAIADGMKECWGHIVKVAKRKKKKTVKESENTNTELEGDYMREEVDSYLEKLEAELFESTTESVMDPDEYLDHIAESMTDETDTEEDAYEEGVTVDEYLDNIVSNIQESADDSNEGEYEESVTVDEYLDSLIN